MHAKTYLQQRTYGRSMVAFVGVLVCVPSVRSVLQWLLQPKPQLIGTTYRTGLSTLGWYRACYRITSTYTHTSICKYPRGCESLKSGSVDRQVNRQRCTVSGHETNLDKTIIQLKHCEKEELEKREQIVILASEWD